MSNNKNIMSHELVQRAGSFGNPLSHSTSSGDSALPTSTGFHSNETQGAKAALAYIDQGMTFDELDKSKLVDDIAYVGALIEVLNARRDISGVTGKSVGRASYKLAAEADSLKSAGGGSGGRLAAISKESAFLLAVAIYMPVLPFRLTLETGGKFVEIAESNNLIRYEESSARRKGNKDRPGEKWLPMPIHGSRSRK